MKLLHAIVRSPLLDALAWFAVSLLFALALLQHVEHYKVSDTGHAEYIGLRGTEADDLRGAAQ